MSNFLNLLLVGHHDADFPELAMEGGADFFYLLVTHQLKDEPPRENAGDTGAKALQKDAPEGIEVQVESEHLEELIRHEPCNKR